MLITNDKPPRDERQRRSPWLAILIGSLVAYVLSSGPVIATGFWLRQATKWEGFYAVMWLYFPLLMLDPDNPVMNYIEWWVDLFDTVGPG